MGIVWRWRSRVWPRMASLILVLIVAGMAGASRERFARAAEQHPAAGNGPQLQLRKTASTAGPVVLGDTYTYSLCYQNTGDAGAIDAILIDDLPKNVDYVGGTATGGGAYDAGSHRLTWNLGALAAGPETCVSLGVRVARNDLPDVGSTGDRAELLLLNRAALSANNAAPAAAQHELILNSIINPVVVKIASSTRVVATDPITFTLTIGNDGNAPATNAVLRDPLSRYVENVSVTSSRGGASYDPASHTVLAPLGVLNPGDRATVVIRARIVAFNRDQGPLNFTNRAFVTYREGNERESNPTLITLIGLPPVEIPEPATLLLLGSGLAGLAGWVARRRRL